MKKRMFSLILTLSMVIGLLPPALITVRAADPVYDGSYTFARTLSGNLPSQVVGSEVVLLDNATITATDPWQDGIHTMPGSTATLVIKGTVTVQGGNGLGSMNPGRPGIRVMGNTIKIVGYHGTTNTLNVIGGKGGDAGNGNNGADATPDVPGSGGSGGFGGSGGGAAIGSEGGYGETDGTQTIQAPACGSVNIDTSNLTVNLTGGAAGNGGKGGNGGSSNGWSVIGAAAHAGGGGGGGGGAGYAGQQIGTGGQGGYKGSRGGSGGSDGSSPSYAGGGGGGAGGQGSTRGGGGGGGGRAISYAGWGGLFTYSGGLGGDAGYGGYSNSSNGSTGGSTDDGIVYNGRGGSIGTISELHLGGAGGATPSNGSPGSRGYDNNNNSQICTPYKTICFNANGGSASSFSMITTSTVGNFPSSNPTRNDYTFQGWATSKTATTANVSTSTWLSSPATTYYAVWKRNSYEAKVTVNKNGSVWTDVPSDKVILSTSNISATTGQKTATPASGVFTFGEIDPSQTMYIWVKNNAGNYVCNSSVSSIGTTATVHYYDVSLSKGTGIDTVTGAGTYLSGETAKISATLKSGYNWDKWSDNNTTMTNYSITVDKKYDLTANTTVVPATAPTLSTTGATLSYGYTTGSVSVTATPAIGHTITGYQWNTCNSDGSNKTIVAGANSATYNIPTGKAVGSYYFVCDVTTTRTDNSQTKVVTTTPSTLVSVNKKAITVSMNNKSRNFGDANPALDFTITSGSLVNSDTITALAVTGATTATQTSNVGTYDITGTSTSTNYDVTINKGTLTVNNKTSQATDYTCNLTAKTYSGIGQGLVVTPKTGIATIVVKYNGVAVSPTDPGTYAVTIDVSSATNYQDITNLSLGNYIINKADAGVTLTSSINPSTYNNEVTFTATAIKVGANGATPTGNIVFKNGGATLATVALVDGVATVKKSDLPALTNLVTAEYLGDSRYNTKTSNTVSQNVNKKPATLKVENTEFFYESGVERKITITETGCALSVNDFAVKYYLVDENNGKLTSVSAVAKAISTGKYLYVIDFAGLQPNYEITRMFTVINTDLPDIASYDNVGYMDIKSSGAVQQKPISFKDGAASVLVTDSTYKNTLLNENASTVTYKSSNDAIAGVANDGTVTIYKAGTVTITATSEKANTTPVYASYVLAINKKPVTITAANDTVVFGTAWDKSTTVTYSDGLSDKDFSGAIDFNTKYAIGLKAGEYEIYPTGLSSEKYEITFVPATLTVTPKTLTASDFSVTVLGKTYDGTKTANVSASIISGIYIGNSVQAEISGSFISENASNSADANYTITGLIGKDADNYVLENGSISGTKTATISPATVSIICASNTTRTYDGNAQTVDVTAMVNGAIFDASNYTVKYNGADTAKDVGIYPISIVLNDNVVNNYTVKQFAANLTIKEATQDAFSIVDIPDRVCYGDNFKVSTQGATGNVSYKSSNADIAMIDNSGNVTVKGVGSVTITATSEKVNTTPVYASYVLTINKKPVTIKAVDDTVVFGTAWDKSTTVTYSDGLSDKDFTGAIDFNTKYALGVKVGEYEISPTGLTSGKYEITFVPAALTVTPKTLTASDFSVTVLGKTYDGTKTASVSAGIISGIYSGNSVQAEISGSFISQNASNSADANYTITGLIGKDADNYVLENGSISGTKTAIISPATVSIICASNTTRTYDGNAQIVDVSAMANGAIFDASNYTVKYNAADTAKDVGIYPISIVLNDNVVNNYTVKDFTANLTINEAAQDVFSIEGTPDRVYYGDNFKISTQGAIGNVSYQSSNADIAMIDNSGNITVKAIGSVTITATSAKEGYTNKTATKTFTVYPRVLTPTATATNRVYNAENGVLVSIDLDNVMASDIITASATGTMANADAGTGKIVYVSSVVIDGAKKDFYTLSESNLQTTVDIDKADVTGFEISADSKKYDRTNIANAKVTNINGIFDADKNQVGISGSAVFDDETSNTGKTVTYTATGITGLRAVNYKFSDDSVKTATTTADITPINIKFNVGTVTFKYDGQSKEVVTSGVDELGRVFTDYTVEYWQNDVKLASNPSEAGDYIVKFVLNNDTNYTTGQTDIPMTIAQIDQEQITIVGLPSTIEYMDEFSLEAVGGSGTGDVSWTSNNQNVSVDASGRVKVNGGVNENVTITVTKKDDTNFTEETARVAFVPQAKTVNLVLSNLTQVFDANDKEITVTPDVRDATYEITYDGNTGLLQNSGIYNVLVKATGNYQGSASAMFTIRKATMNGLKITQDGCTYGETLTDASYDDAPSGANVSVKYSTLDGNKPTKAGTYAVTATYTGDNYETYVASTEFTIEKKQLTVKANDAQRKFGESNPEFTLSFDGFAEGEGLKNLLSEPTAICSANASSPVSEYEIEVKGGQADNYRFNYNNSGKLKVTGAAGKNFYITGANNSVMVGDIFTLHAYYDNVKPKVKWESSDNTVATVDQEGTVRILKMGEATITATVTDTNYENGINATFKLNTSKKMLLLKAEDLVKVYNTERQDIKLVSDDANFVPMLFGDNKNIDIVYTLTTDSTVTEPKQAGTYTVTYSINHPSYMGSGTVTMYINKATATITARDLTKVYGEQNPGYGITGLIGNDELNADYISKIFSIFKVTSDADATGVKTKVGEYPITLAVKEGRTLNDDANYNLVISDAKAKLTVTKAPLNIKVSDASRAYSTENINPKYEYVGFVNNETEADLTQKPVFTYDASIKKETNVGTYADVITASGAESGNYEIIYSYADGSKSNLTVTSLPITVKAGTARSSYLTVELDKPLAGLNKDSFKVTLNGAPVEIANVTADSTTSYSLIGSFKIGSQYSVALTANPNYTVSGSPVSITPISPGGGSGGSIGGVGSVSSSTYTISVTQGKNGKISPDSVQVDKNGHKDFTITPNKGYKIKDVLVDGKSVGAVESYTFKSVTANARITAVFEKVEEKPTEPSKGTNPFNDVDERDWFYDAVKYVNENKLMGGTETDEFAPNVNITRGMFVMVLYRMENEPTTELSSFYDVSDDEYYAKAVGWASSNGIVKGISKTGFAPNENITREQMAVIVSRYAKFKGIDVSATGNTSYTDNGSISDYAKEAISWASEKGIMKGNTDGSFAPTDNSTRAQAAAVFMRIIEKLK